MRNYSCVLLICTPSSFLQEQCDLQDHTFLLWLAVKYQTRAVLRRVMVVLQHHFPDTLKKRDHWATAQNQRRIDPNADVNAQCHFLYKPVYNRYPHMISPAKVKETHQKT